MLVNSAVKKQPGTKEDNSKVGNDRQVILFPNYLECSQISYWRCNQEVEDDSKGCRGRLILIYSFILNVGKSCIVRTIKRQKKN
ncbi:hypothetical protein CEXT_340151 [Caerostris extrusa]|uniref:Uncharacterized protein n=1 Tax=Caerostris extrusa TaxID=172846 RepID=A0AAV4NLS0_CAEEX|nr:hypothetical protein CEXT_340151 [Caerostris extrusa]